MKNIKNGITFINFKPMLYTMKQNTYTLTNYEYRNVSLPVSTFLFEEKLRRDEEGRSNNIGKKWTRIQSHKRTLRGLKQIFRAFTHRRRRLTRRLRPREIK
jgi:hypothetical protein